MRLREALLVLFAMLVPACGRQPEPIQPLQQVSEGDKLRVKHRLSVAPKEGEVTEIQGVLRDTERAIVEQLRAAGYDVVEEGKYDVGMSISLQTEQERSSDPEFRFAEVIFTDHNDRVVDRIAFAMKPGAAPAKEPTRVANLVVNAAVESKKLSAYAEERRERRKAARAKKKKED